MNHTLIDTTLALMDILDHTEEYGDCLLWTASTNKGGYPHHKPKFVHGLDRRMTCTMVRRDLVALCDLKVAPRQPLLATCGERLCVNPAHLKPSSSTAIGKAAAARGAWKTLSRAAAIAAVKRLDAKLTMEIAREIRASDEPSMVLAARHGVDKSLITRIRAGKAWRDFSNPYLSLMAA